MPAPALQRRIETGDASKVESPDIACEAGDDLVALSPREIEIIRLVARGHPDKRIAMILDIRPTTVNTYLRRLFAKLGVRSRSAAAAQFMLRYDIRVD